MQAFEQIYKECSGFVYNVVYRVVHHYDDAKEVTQEVFIAVYKKLSSFEFKSSLKTWIYRIAVNTAINYAKKRSKESNRTVELNEQTHQSSLSYSGSDSMTNEQKEASVAHLLDQLNPDQRACLVLRSVEGLSYEEIAQSLNINVNTVRSRLKRAREKLLAFKNEVIKNEM